MLYKKQQGQWWLEQNGKSDRKWSRRSGDTHTRGQIWYGLLRHFKNIVLFWVDRKLLGDIEQRNDKVGITLVAW